MEIDVTAPQRSAYPARLFRLVALIALVITTFAAAPTGAAADERFFPETGFAVRGQFLAY